MIARLVEAILRPVLALTAHLMTQLFLAPFRALFGGSDPPEDEEAPDALSEAEKDRLQLEEQPPREP